MIYVDEGAPLVAARAMIVVRGLPGTARPWVAREIAKSIPESVIVSADDYFRDAKGHNFPFRTSKPTKAEIDERRRNPRAYAFNQLRRAYRECVAAARAAVEKRLNVIVDNPTVRKMEWEQWRRMISSSPEYSFFVVEGDDGEEDVEVLSQRSGIAVDTIQAMDVAWDDTPGVEITRIRVQCEAGLFGVDRRVLEMVSEFHSNG